MNPVVMTMIKLLAAALFGGAVILFALAAWKLVQKRARRSAEMVTSIRRAEMRQLALQRSPAFRIFLPMITTLAATIERIGLEPVRQYVHEPYVRAGYPGGMDDDELVATGALLAILLMILIGFMAGALFGPALVWLALVGLPLGFFLLVMHLKTKAEERELEIIRALPYVIDLLVLMLRSGTSMRIAMARVIDDYQGHPFSVELGQVLAEIDVGSPRAEAFRKMSDRLKIPDITSLVDAIVQSEELGWPLAETLERQADRINSERVLRAQATAGAAGVLVMLPSALVLLSAIFLLFAPFIVRYMVTGALM